MPEHQIKQVINWLDLEYLATLASLLWAFVYVGLGRLAMYVNIEKRLPTLKELFRDIFLVAFMGIVCSGFLEFLDVQNVKVIGGASALFGYFGPRSIDIILRIICKKFGFNFYSDLCALDDIHDGDKRKK